MTNATKTSQAKGKSSQAKAKITKTFYVIRRGWNAANQSSRYSQPNPRDTFESCLDELVATVEASSADEACKIAAERVVVYPNQFLRATANPRSEKGLTRAIRERCEADAVEDAWQ